MNRQPLWLAAATISLAGAAAAAAGDAFLTVYLQQSFPKQTNTNKQIEQINRTFGVDFDTWDDVANVSLGGQLFRQVSPAWRVGLEFDISRGGIDGRATVLTEAGPATLRFEQTYSVYTDVMALARFVPCGSCRTVVPFALGGLGVAYEKDTTTLTLRNEVLDERLRVDNDGFFPMFTAGVGVDAFLFGASPWYLEVGASYVWARLDHMVKAKGSLAPAERVRADQDSTGPAWWLGLGRKL